MVECVLSLEAQKQTLDVLFIPFEFSTIAMPSSMSVN